MNQADSTAVSQQIEALIHGPQYAMTQAEKEAVLVPLLRWQCRDQARRCPAYGRFLDRFGGDPDSWRSPADVPPLPAAMFKRFLLSAVPPEQVVRELHSSTTTGRQPSRIMIDKTTAFRQSRALAAILKEHIGHQRLPLLVLDSADSLTDNGSLNARGAAVRGIATFASETVYAMDRTPEGDLAENGICVAGFFAKHHGRPVLIFGMTYIVWSRFILEVERRGVSYHAPQAVMLHSGGWKKLAAESVSKEEFNRRAAAVFGIEPGRILDFYGMVEQVGTVFVDCESGNKHAAAFADVVLRRPLTLAPVEIGERGIIEVISVLPESYPGHALLTEDQGILLGVDDCPCGRKGRYFRFTSRIERAELRGCGDTFAESRAI